MILLLKKSAKNVNVMGNAGTVFTRMSATKMSEKKVVTTADITCTLEQMRLDNANVFLDKKWVPLEEWLKLNQQVTHKRILELEDKIDRAKRILNDFVIQFDFGGSITSQRALINEARSILVLNQEKKEPYCFGKFDKKCEDCQSYCMYRGACEKSSVANGDNKP
jgi:hypothetical protein